MWLRVLILWLLPSLALAGSTGFTWTTPQWNNDGTPIGTITGYRLYERCAPTGAFSLVQTFPGNTIAGTRNGHADNATCYWQLATVTALGEGLSGVVQRVVPPVSSLPGAPTNLVITWAPTQGQGPPSMAATVISAEVLTLEFNSDPAAVNITIPSDATAVYAFLGGWVSGGSGNPVVSVALNGNNPSQSFQLNQSGDAPHGAVSAWYNPATGTQSLNYDVNFSPSEGNVCTVVYVKGGDTTAWRDADAARSTGATAISVTLDTASGDLVILFDQRWSATAPGTPSGFTSVTTQTNYGSRSSRVSYISATGSTQVATAENESYSGIVAISIPAGAEAASLPPRSAAVNVAVSRAGFH